MQRGPQTAIRVREDGDGLIVSTPAWVLRRWWRFALLLLFTARMMWDTLRDGMWVTGLIGLVIVLLFLLPHRVLIAPDRWAVAGRSRRRRWDHVDAVQVSTGEEPTVLLRLTDGALIDTQIPDPWAERVAIMGRVPLRAKKAPPGIPA